MLVSDTLNSSTSKTAVPALQPHIPRHILLLRAQRVMLDAELASGVAA